MNSSIIHDNFCKLIHEKYHPQSYHRDIKYLMTLNIICSVGRSCIQSSMTTQGVSQWIGDLSATPSGLIIKIMYSHCFTFEIMYSSCFTSVSQRCGQSISNQRTSLFIRKLCPSTQPSFMYHKALVIQNHKIQPTPSVNENYIQHHCICKARDLDLLHVQQRPPISWCPTWFPICDLFQILCHSEIQMPAKAK